MKDFHSQSGAEITEAISGKAIVKVEIDDGMYDFLIFHFTDGSALRIRYDWLYEWELQNVASELLEKAYQEGYSSGQRAKEKAEQKPEPYPPYQIGTQEANAWLRGYRYAREPENLQEST